MPENLASICSGDAVPLSTECCAEALVSVVVMPAVRARTYGN